MLDLRVGQVRIGQAFEECCGAAAGNILAGVSDVIETAEYCTGVKTLVLCFLHGGLQCALGGLFGGSFPGSTPVNPDPVVPDFRLLYGVFPTPQPLYGVSISPSPPTNIIAYYGVGTTTITPPSNTGIGSIVAYYGIAVPEYGVGLPY